MGMPACWRCDNKFPRADKRGFYSKERPDLAMCPLCNATRNGEAWAIWNGCNGVFTTEVYDTKAAADAECAKLEWDGCKVVPVRVILEPGDDVWQRALAERDRTVGPSVDRRWP